MVFSDVVCLSLLSVKFVHRSGDWNFPQCFYDIWYDGHPLTSG